MGSRTPKRDEYARLRKAVDAGGPNAVEAFDIMAILIWNEAIQQASDEAYEHRLFANGPECAARCIALMKKPVPFMSWFASMAQSKSDTRK